MGHNCQRYSQNKQLITFAISNSYQFAALNSAASLLKTIGSVWQHFKWSMI